MIDPVVRRGSAADADQLVELERAARLALVDQRGGRRWLDEHPERGAEWAVLVEQVPVFVAVLDDVVVGYLVLDVARDERAGTVARVDEIFVDPAAREVGFGDELLAAAVEHARASGAAVFEGEALPGDRNTKNLYERAGITARSIVVSTRLDDG